MVIGRVCVVPTGTSPKFSGAGATVNLLELLEVVPVPVRGMVAASGPEINRLPPVMPADCGAKVTFNVTLWPGFRLNGNPGPPIENSLPMIWAAKRVTFQGRSFLSTTGTVVLVPIATGPNETIEGLAFTASLLTPAPATPSVRLEFEALLEKWSVPDVQLSDVGVKLTLTSTLCPASKTSGRLKPDALNSGLLTTSPETVRLVCPVFVTVTNKVSV